MKKILRNSLLFLYLLLAKTQSFAQVKNHFSVKQTVEYGIKNAAQVKNALLDIKIQQQVNREFTAAAFPQINSSISVNNFLDIPVNLLPGELVGMPGTRVPIQFGTKYNANAGVEFSQIIFDGQVFIGLKARAASIALATKTAEMTIEQIKANIYKIYYQLVVGKKQLTSIDANIERFEKLLNDTKEIYKNGFAEKLDVDKVTVQLNNLKTEKVKIENQLEIGNAGLKFLINMPQKEILILTDTLSEDELKAHILEEEFNYKDRKEFQLLTTAAKLNTYNIQRFKLSKFPSIVAFGSYTKNAQRSEFDFFGKGEWFTTTLIGLKVSIPIFDGNARNAKIQKAKYELAKVSNNLEQIKQSIDYEIANAKTNMKNALLTMDNQKKNIVLSEKVYHTTKLKYEQGLGSNQEIYNAQAELKMAQTNYYSALYDAINAKIDYLKAVGKL